MIFHHVPAAWPPHELPSDFWRISTEGLRVLFATGLGMKVEGHGCGHPLHMYLDDKLSNQEMFSIVPAYAFSAVLARKIREIDYSRFSWDMTAAAALGAEGSYPLR